MTLKILMVDDEPDAEELFRQNFRREIRKQHYEFFFAQTGEEALDLLKTDLTLELLVVLSDINMPGMSGVELLGEVKKIRPSLPVMMITAYGDAQTIEHVKQRGAKDLLSKPVDFARLKVDLENLSRELQR